MRVLVFGDSITYGAWDKEGGWVQRLRKFLEKKNFFVVYNLGVSGNDTNDLLERFEFETNQRLKEGEETVILFAIGTNDSQFLHKESQNRVPIENFKENIRKLIKLARKFSSKIAFVGLTPVDETKTDPIPWDRNKSYKNEFIQKYNQAIKTICNENKISFIEVFEKLKGKNQNFLEDGLHPNSNGHQQIFELVKDFFK